jgi:hypothetical protein
MRIDFRHSLNEGMNNLMTWRNRYSKTEYAEKVVLNIFYRKYSIEFMFPEIIGCFETNFLGEQKVKWHDFNEGFQKLKTIYESTAILKTQPVLLNLLTNTQRIIGNTNYEIFIPLISEAKSGNKSKLEEIEYAYLYYLITDECVLLWGAFGGTGLTKIDTVLKMSGAIINTEEIKTYGQIEQVLGRLCAAAYLKENYKALLPNV